MTIYEILASTAIVTCLAIVGLIYFMARFFKQSEKTLIEIEKTITETREKTLKNVELITEDVKDLTTDIKGKTKKLDPAFDAVEKISQLTSLAKVAYELWSKKKK